jgi:uncharacterized phage-like protein YoqJ
LEEKTMNLDIDINKTACFTGHRPSKLIKKDMGWIKREIENAIDYLYETYGIDTFLCGGALGIDQTSANIVINLRDDRDYPIKIIIVEPFEKFTDRWNDVDVLAYTYIKNKADQVICLSTEEYSPRLYFKRNSYMANNSSWVIGIWDGSTGGTYNMLQTSKGRKNQYIIDPNTRETKIIDNM